MKLFPDQRPYAYENKALYIGNGQTISQPYIVAIMTDLLKPKPSSGSRYRIGISGGDSR